MFQLVYNRNNIDVLNTFNWFGIVLQSNGSFFNATQTLADKYVRARNSLFRIMKTMEVPVNVNFDLFETYVAFILS